MGPYPGWDVNGPWAFGVLRELAPIYGAFPLRRAALRYLNRIAIPERTDLREWFTVISPDPAGLTAPYIFQFGQTWERVKDRDDMSATVRLVTIAIEETSVQKGNQGALLDIEIFLRRGVNPPP